MATQIDLTKQVKGVLPSANGGLTAADKSKLDGIAAGAEVNVNADWNAGSGDAQILNKPTLGDAAAKNTGTTAGTVAAGDHSHSSTTYNVKSYGAVGNGITDDYTAVAATFAAVPAAGGIVFFPAGTYLLSTAISIPRDNIQVVGEGQSATTIRMANASNYDAAIACPLNRSHFRIADLTLDGNYINQASGYRRGISLYGGHDFLIERCTITKFGPAAQDNSIVYAVLANAVANLTIRDCIFLSNWYSDICVTNSGGSSDFWNVQILDNRFGAPSLAESNSATTWWDTQSAAAYSIGVSGYNNVQVRGNRIYGAVKKAFLGNPIVVTLCSNVQIIDNTVDSLGNGSGVVGVTSGAAGVTGTNAYFNTGAPTGGDLYSFMMVEGDATIYQISTVVSTSSVVVTPVIARGNGTGLRYRISSTGDAINASGCTKVVMRGNIVRYSHDQGFGVSYSGSTPSKYVTVDGNVAHCCIGNGFYITGAKYGSFSNNVATNNGQVGTGAASDDHRAGLHFTGTTGADVVQNFVVDNNVFADDQTPATQKVGIGIVGTGVTSNILGENIFVGLGTADITGTKITQAFLRPCQSAACSTDLTLTTAMQDVPGATITLNQSGSWLVTGVFYMKLVGADTGSFLQGVLVANGGTLFPAAVYLSAATGDSFATVSQQWLVSGMTVGNIVKLQAKKTGGSGTSVCAQDHTVITARWVGY